MIRKLMSGHLVDDENLEQMNRVHSQLKFLFTITAFVLSFGVIMLMFGLLLWIFL